MSYSKVHKIYDVVIIDRSFGGQNHKNYKKGDADPDLKVLYGNDCNLFKNLSKISKLSNQDSSYSDKSAGKYKIAEFPIRNFVPHLFKTSLKFDRKYVSNLDLDLGSFVSFDIL